MARMISAILFITLVFFYAEASKAKPAKRVALIIGISEYSHLQTLSNPVRDAKAVAALLRKYDFAVFEHIDLDHASFKAALKEFDNQAKAAEEAVVFYAGHGMTALQDNRLANVLAPTDADISCQTRAAQRTITMQEIAEAIKDVPKQVLLFDSCRDEPIRDCQSNALMAKLEGFQPARLAAPQIHANSSRGVDDNRGLRAAVDMPEAKGASVLVAYSTDLGATASDGEPGKHSPFAQALIEELERGPALPIYKILVRTSSQVERTFGQRPWVVTKGGEPDICLRGNDCETGDALRNQKLVEQSRFLADRAMQNINRDDRTTAMLLALEALPDSIVNNAEADKTTRPYVAEAEVALLQAYFTKNELVVLAGHTRNITRVTYSSNGQYIATASEDGTARVWDANTGKQVTILSGHTNMLRSVAFSPDSVLIVTASDDKTARVWNSSTGEMLTVLKGHHDWVMSAIFSPDGALIATTSRDKTIRLWDVETGRQTLVFNGHKDLVSSVEFSIDGSLMVSASNDRTAIIWELSTGKRVAVLEGHGNYIRSASFSPEGTFVVTSSDDGTARVWNTKTGTQIALLKGHNDVVSKAVYSPNGSSILTTSFDNTARIWEAKTGKTVRVLEGHTDHLFGASFSTDGSHIVTFSSDGTARLWNTVKGKTIEVFEGHIAEVWSGAFSPDGSRVVTSSQDRTARIWTVGKTNNYDELNGHTASVRSAQFGSDDSRIVTASDDHTTRIWNAKLHRQSAVLKGHSDVVTSCSFQ